MSLTLPQKRVLIALATLGTAGRIVRAVDGSVGTFAIGDTTVEAASNQDITASDEVRSTLTSPVQARTLNALVASGYLRAEALDGSMAYMIGDAARDVVAGVAVGVSPPKRGHADRRQALQDLIRASEEDGLYDRPEFPLESTRPGSRTVPGGKHAARRERRRARCDRQQKKRARTSGGA